jgi:ariadne-1
LPATSFRDAIIIWLCAYRQVPASLVTELASADQRDKYRTYLLRSFVEDNPAMSWCTGKVHDSWARC